MADYYPLLARALDALPDRSPDLRHTVYERARAALIGQLRSLDPPLSEADIEAERVSLDRAIARLEIEHGGVPEPEPALSGPTVSEAATPEQAAPEPPPPAPPGRRSTGASGRIPLPRPLPNLCPSRRRRTMRTPCRRPARRSS